MIITRPQLQEMFGNISHSTVQRFEREGMPIEVRSRGPGGGNQYDAAKVVEWRLQRERDKFAKKQHKATSHDPNIPSKEKSEQELAALKVEREKRALQRDAGKLLSVQAAARMLIEARIIVARLADTVRERLEADGSLPPFVHQRVQQIIDDAIDYAETPPELPVDTDQIDLDDADTLAVMEVQRLFNQSPFGDQGWQQYKEVMALAEADRKAREERQQQWEQANADKHAEWRAAHPHIGQHGKDRQH